jgi:hypothetical protein
MDQVSYRERALVQKSYMCSLLLYVACFMTSSAHQTIGYSVERCDWWIINWKGLGRKQCFSDRGNIATFAWTDWEKVGNTSVRTAGVLVEIRTQRIPPTGLDCYGWTSLLRLFFFHSLLRPTPCCHNEVSVWIHCCVAVWPKLQCDFCFPLTVTSDRL